MTYVLGVIAIGILIFAVYAMMSKSSLRKSMQGKLDDLREMLREVQKENVDLEARGVDLDADHHRSLEQVARLREQVLSEGARYERLILEAKDELAAVQHDLETCADPGAVHARLSRILSGPTPRPGLASFERTRIDADGIDAVSGTASPSGASPDPK